MTAFLIRRLVQAVVSIIGVLTLVFFLLQLAGDPVLLMVPVGSSSEDIEDIRRSLGLDRSILERYFAYVVGFLSLDLGNSIVQNISVTEIIVARIPYTVALAGAALAIAIGIGVPLGFLTAIWQDRAPGRLITGLVLAAQSIPTFWSSILLVLIFAVWLGWLPASGATGPAGIVLPAIALGFFSMATFARITRSAVVEELSREYVRTAHSKGLSTGRIMIRHVSRNASISVIAITALEMANLLTGAIIVETVFAWPGLGQATIQALSGRDFPVVQGVVLLGAVTAIALNLIADILYGLVDPRIRPGRR